MSLEEKILLWQTIGVWVAVVIAPLTLGGTVWAMFRQTTLASNLANGSRRQECLEALLAAYKAGPIRSGREYYSALNRVPVLFASDATVLAEYRRLRDLSVHRDPERANEVLRRLLLLMAHACGLPLTEADIEAALGVQWGANDP